MKKLFELKEDGEGFFLDRGSKFLGFVVRIRDEEDAHERMKEMKKNHPKANHLCYAYRVKKNNQIVENLSDDGEPSHSAGQPILRQLQAEDLINSLAMVVRYFGGVKLGVGGLMKAYKNATVEALKTTNKTAIVDSQELQLQVDYSNWGNVLAILDRENLSFEAEHKEKYAEIKLEVPTKKVNEVKELFAALQLKIT